MADPLALDIEELPGVSPARLELLHKLGLRTVGDLLFHLPRSYEDLTDVRPIAKLMPDKLQTVVGEVVEIEGWTLVDGRPVVSVVLRDGENYLQGLWFNQPGAARRLTHGSRVSFGGRPRWYRDQRHNREHWQMINPCVQLLEKNGPASAGIVPIYPLTEDLRPDVLRMLIRKAVDRHAGQIADVLPAHLRERHGFPLAREALRHIHCPASLEQAENARRRFVYEEFLQLQLALALRRRELRDRERAPSLTVTPEIDARIRRLFPFTLTQDQDRAVAEVCRDLARYRPMQRLLQADVGAGKTAVAVYALLVAVANRRQAVLMAPTEILARQHAQTLDRYLSASRVRRALLTGSLSERERRAVRQGLAAGDLDLVIGTQALAQEGVAFARLGLVVIDEQHRFGVSQRARMRWADSAGTPVDPHYLVMTATPIPRTVALTVFGDLDVSVLRQVPPGRQPVQTRWVRGDRREEVYARIREGLTQGRQAYVVCPLIEESGRVCLRPAEKVYHELKSGPFKDFRVGLLHGKLDGAERDRVMADLVEGRLNMLVCTSIIEVGVDVPAATLLVVEDAEQFGLSQLHQLRGRVCRGNVAGECYLFADPPTEEGENRLRLFVRTQDGFSLAEEDARLRGAGELFGTRQHGTGELRLGDPIRDAGLLQLARKDAFELVAGDANLSAPACSALRQAVLARFGPTLDLSQVG